MDVAALIAAKRKTLQGQKLDNGVKNGVSEDENEDIESENKIVEGGSNTSDDSISDSSSEGDDEGPAIDDSHKGLAEDVLKTRSGKHDDEGEGGDYSDSEGEDKMEVAKAAAFFDDQPAPRHQDEIQVFNQLSLSRPLLRGVAAMGFVKPTPIQAAVIPLALAGRDICASAVTGSGKTAAFLLPILERLLHRYSGRTKAIILTPTRELAAQCLGMLTSFAQFTNLRASLIVGGAKNVNAQAAELRSRPNVIVATPGRLLDHITNSAGVTLEDIEILVLDEADRLLDLGFQDEVHELVKACPVQRQTLLFSATMNTKVDDLIQLSMKRPVRVRISDKANSMDIEVAPRLEQEFVRVRAGNEGANREGMLLALLTRTFKKQTIVFFDTKAAAHRLMILCGLCGIKCAELHGNLSQQQRLTALEEFRKGDVDVLLATDLAARGLDIDRVKTVINFEMPSQVATYVHRIGRTARAGRGGRSCTLIGEGRRHLMKELIKDAEVKNKRHTTGDTAKSSFESGVIRSRTIPPAVMGHFVAKIQSLETHVDEVFQAEAIAKMDRLAEMEVIKAQNIIQHSDEIKARPQREWFASEKQKKLTKEQTAEKQRQIAEKVGTGMHRMTRKKRRGREALAALEAPEGKDDVDESEVPSKPIKNMKSTARAKKRKDEEREHEVYTKSVHDVDEDRARKAAKKNFKPRGADAVGDSSLFSEERVSFRKESTKKADTPARTSYNFSEFDPNKKFGKKKSHNGFKSKSKYKRRK
jgi:ATP-dependent RNA helicase DDX27